MSGTDLSYSVVVPAYQAERTLGSLLEALGGQDPAPREVIVVDDGSTDRTSEIASSFGTTVICSNGVSYAGGARNRGWDAAGSDVVVFLDADAIPGPGWGDGVVRAGREFPGAIVGCARTFAPRTAWGWVSHLQIETPYLPRGGPRGVKFVSSSCMAVPRDVSVRFDESWGGEDVIFCADALAAGIPLVFDPRFYVLHNHGRETFGQLRRQQQRLAYSLARGGVVQRQGLHKRILSRVPIHYFGLVRLPLIFARVRGHRALRRRFLRLLPRLILAEWSLGIAALRYTLRRPPLRDRAPSFR